MKNNSSLIPLEVLAKSIASGMGDSTGRFVFTLTRHLLSGYRELNLFVGQDTEIKTAVLESDNVVPLPCDFVYQTKVGVLYKGVLAVLSLEKGIQRKNLNQQQSENILNEIWGGQFLGYDQFTFFNAFRGSQFLGELYGFGRGVISEGFYDINKSNGELYIGSLIPEGAEIVIEYKSDGISDGLKLVPTEMEMCLSYWAKARFYEERKDYVSAEWNMREYDKHYYRVKRLYNFQNALYLSAKVNEMFSPSNY